jgi:3-isopropylmalate/(R)-2-methylmalate dehydratase small subunit
MKFTGKVWKFGPNINTDLMLPGALQHAPPAEQISCVFAASRPGWVVEVQPGDIIIGGVNFGMGSSRPAARSLKLLGLACLVADSINGLFYRNAVNFGFPALECPGVAELFEEGEMADISFEDFTVKNTSRGTSLQAPEIPASLLGTMEAGGIYPLLENEGLIAAETG